MKYLLDVNALIALGVFNHQFHARMTAWAQSLASPRFLTCSITELGFVRILERAAVNPCTVLEAKNQLLQLKHNTILPFEFIADANDISELPAWTRTAKQTTGGHLLALAQSHGAQLATLHQAIPGAFLIP